MYKLLIRIGPICILLMSFWSCQKIVNESLVKAKTSADNLQTCTTYITETLWYWNPDGDPCNCNGDEYYSYSTFEYNSVCVEGGGGGTYLGGTTTYVQYIPHSAGGGTTSPPPPGPSPCDRVAKLTTDADFINHFKDVQTKAKTANYESGYIYTDLTNAPRDWSAINGQANQPGIDIKVAKPLDGLLHSHYSGLLSIFSPDDIRDIYILDNAHNINSVLNFTLGVSTSANTNYVIKIEDLDEFRTFANNYLNSDIGFSLFSNIYENLYQIKPSNTSAMNELNFLKFLKITNSGLRLFKANDNFTYYTPLGLDANNNEVVTPCP